MKIYVRQIRVEYNYNPLGRYFNLWFYRHNKCIFTATLFKPEWFLESISVIGKTLSLGNGLRTHKSWTPDTHELIIEGRN